MYAIHSSFRALPFVALTRSVTDPAPQNSITSYTGDTRWIQWIFMRPFIWEKVWILHKCIHISIQFDHPSKLLRLHCTYNFDEKCMFHQLNVSFYTTILKTIFFAINHFQLYEYQSSVACMTSIKNCVLPWGTQLLFAETCLHTD